MSGSQFKIKWLDRGREPKCPPDPAYLKGIDIDSSGGAARACKTELPYPAKRCGVYYVECEICGTNAAITTAGRPDDPRSVTLPCKIKGKVQ
jgi:hypothetical protein